MSDIAAENYSIKQLREWLRKIDMPINGNKAVLALRLNAVPVEIRGDCPNAVGELENTDEVNTEMEDEPSDSGRFELASNYGKERESETLKRELALLQREKDVLLRENELLKKQKYVESVTVPESNGRNDLPFATVKDLITEYDGTGSIDLWTAQLQNVGKICAILKAMHRHGFFPNQKMHRLKLMTS